MLLEDGAVSITEKEEPYYHEMIAHVPMNSFPQAKRVLVIGGGDGGVVQQLLKHENIEEIVVAELDDLLVQAAKAHFPSLASSLSDPKVQLIITESQEFLKSNNDGSFDVIIIDEADPVARRNLEDVGVQLFCSTFWKECYRVLGENGVIVSSARSPSTEPKEFKAFYGELVSLFGKKHVKPYIFENATNGLMSFAFINKGNIDSVETFVGTEKANDFADKHNLYYYDGEVHYASFVLPKKYRRMFDDTEIS